MAEVRQLRRFKRPVNNPYDFEYRLAYAIIEDTTDDVVSVEDGEIKAPSANTEANLTLFTAEVANAESSAVKDWPTV